MYICTGISNLSHVRVANMNELVYKSGQARVTKASVTIVFDNNGICSNLLIVINNLAMENESQPVFIPIRIYCFILGMSLDL